MTESNRFTLRPRSDIRTPSSDVLLDGRDLGLDLKGSRLERQYLVARSGLFVLFVTDDIPYEETLRIYLFDDCGRLLETRSLGEAYTAGLLTDVEPHSENGVTFSFQGRWRLVVHENAVGLVRRRLELSRSAR